MKEFYNLMFKQSAMEEIFQAPQDYVRLILNDVEYLSINPYSHKSQHITGSGIFRLKIGDFRVIYQVVESRKLIIVYAVYNKREVFREFMNTKQTRPE